MEIPARRPAWRDPRLIVGLALIAVSIILTTSIVSAARGGATVYRATQAILPGDVLGPTTSRSRGSTSIPPSTPPPTRSHQGRR